MKKKKAAPRRQVKSKPPVTRRSGKIIRDAFDGLNPASPVFHRWNLKRLAPEIKDAAKKLAFNREHGKGPEVPSEALLDDLLAALGSFRIISRRSPEASLMTLAAEADKMWESLRLCEEINNLAANLKPWMIEPPVRIRIWIRKNPGYAVRFQALINQNAVANPSDLEKLIPLVSEQLRKQIEVILSEDPRKNARSDEVQRVLAHLCVDFLREREARYAEQQRLLQPLFRFFCLLDGEHNVHLLCKAGFISETAKQLLITDTARERARASALERKRRERRKKARPEA